MSHPTRREFLASLSATAIGASRFPLRLAGVLAERRVDAGLIAAALALEPRDDVGIEAKASAAS